MLKPFEKNSIPDLATYVDLLNSKNILVTGAASGIGRALSIAAARQGATIVLLDQDDSGLNRVYDEIVSMNLSEPLIIQTNLAGLTENAGQEIAEGVTAQCGGLDGLVHCAAVLGDLKMLRQYSYTKWQEVLKVNLDAPFLLTKACLPLMLASSAGSIIFSTCDLGRNPKAYWGAYGVSKSGIDTVATIFASETESLPTRVNLIDPGAVRTQLRAEAFPAENPSNIKSPSSVMDAYLYLLSDMSLGVHGYFLTP